MPLTCTDPNFPVPKRLNVLQDATFTTEDNWNFSGGWVWGVNGIVGTSVTNGVHFQQTSGNFLLPYGADDTQEIVAGDLYEYFYVIDNQDSANLGKIRIVWGANVTSFIRGSSSGLIAAPASGNIQLAVQSGANTFFGRVKSFNLFTQRCVAAGNEDEGSSGGAGGEGGSIVTEGEEAKTIYAKSLYTDERIERFREDLLTADEIDDTYATGSQE